MSRLVIGFGLLLTVLLGAAQGFGLVDPFSFSWDAQIRDVKPGESFQVSVLFEIPPEHYLYKDKLTLILYDEAGLELQSLKFSPSLLRWDRFSNKKLEIFEEFALITAQLYVPETLAEGQYEASFEIQYQGCSPKLCFRQQAKEVVLPFRVGSVPVQETHEARAGIVEQLRASLEGRGWMAYLLAFLGGLLTDFTPCVLPLIPLTLAVIGIRRETSHRKNFLLTGVLVLGMAFTYALFGVIATVLGLQLGFLFQNPFFLLLGAVLFLLFALGLFGLYELQLPLFLRNALARVGGRGYGGAVIAGMTLGLLAAPCVGPVIGALLVWVAQTQDLVQGFSLLFVFGLGMGSLILLVGTFYGAMAGRIHGGTASMIVKWGLGVLLLVPAAYYAYVAYGAFTISLPESASMTQAAELRWVKDADQALQKARDEEKHVLVDFWAEWCLPCLEWDEENFSRPHIQRAIETSFVPLKVDCTQNTGACNALVKRYQVVGWPTILVLDETGQLVPGSKIVGEVLEQDEFLRYLNKFKP